MALQLKNKAKEEKTDVEKGKKGKYKRKRNVFGKRLTRFGLIGVILLLVVSFAVVKVVFTLQQNNKQKKIDQDLVNVKAQIKEYKRQINKKADNYENVGELIATLPVSFDQQAISLDLDRMVILSGLTESTTVTRKINTNVSTMPFECSVQTLKTVQINMTLYCENDDINSILKFMDCLSDYKHENFYYVESLEYFEDRSIFKRGSIQVILYTFYNDVEIATTTPTDNTNTNTTTK